MDEITKAEMRSTAVNDDARNAGEKLARDTYSNLRKEVQLRMPGTNGTLYTSGGVAFDGNGERDQFTRVLVGAFRNEMMGMLHRFDPDII